MRVTDRDIGVSAWALLPAIILTVLMEEYTKGNLSRDEIILYSVYFGAMIVVMWLLSLGKRVFSETGITKQYLWIKKHYAWDQVIQVCLLPLDTDTSVKQFAFTFSGGSPWKTGETLKWWGTKNGGKCLRAKYSEELHALILQCYGPLDF